MVNFESGVVEHTTCMMLLPTVDLELRSYSVAYAISSFTAWLLLRVTMRSESPTTRLHKQAAVYVTTLPNVPSPQDFNTFGNYLHVTNMSVINVHLISTSGMDRAGDMETQARSMTSVDENFREFKIKFFDVDLRTILTTDWWSICTLAAHTNFRHQCNPLLKQH